MALRHTSRSLKRILSNVEVERKFNPNSKFVSLLSDYGALSVLSQPGQLIRDTYYDTEDQRLSKLGLWVRQRSVHALPPSPTPAQNNESREVVGRDLAHTTSCKGEAGWNAKLRVGGDFTNSQFIEFDGKKNVSREVLRTTGMTTRLEDLHVNADLHTRRSVWEVMEPLDVTPPSAKMTIVVDVVTKAEAGDGAVFGNSAFGHTIGEVELAQTVTTEEMDNVGHEAHRKEIATQRMKELEEFMLAHTDLFPTSPTPIGKLAAYYKWKTASSQP